MAKEHLRGMPLAPSGRSEPLAIMQHGKLAQSSDSPGENQEKLEFWELHGSHTCLLEVSPEKQPKARGTVYSGLSLEGASVSLKVNAMFK